LWTEVERLKDSDQRYIRHQERRVLRSLLRPYIDGLPGKAYPEEILHLLDSRIAAERKT